MSSLQRITIVLLIGYVFWEIGIWFWKRSLPESDPLIRVDLVVIYPILVTFCLISLYQYSKRKK